VLGRLRGKGLSDPSVMDGHVGARGWHRAVGPGVRRDDGWRVGK